MCYPSHHTQPYLLTHSQTLIVIKCIAVVFLVCYPGCVVCVVQLSSHEEETCPQKIVLCTFNLLGCEIQVSEASCMQICLSVCLCVCVCVWCLMYVMCVSVCLEIQVLYICVWMSQLTGNL